MNGPTVPHQSYVPDRRRKLRLMVARGPDKGRSVPLEPKIYVVGKDPACDFPLTDPTVSRRHLEIDVLADRIEVRDLKSTNGSFLGGVRFQAIHADAGTAIVIGDTELRLVAEDDLPGTVERFGALVARSARMRALFETARRVAQTGAAVLIEGETGTGKELLAEAIHGASARAQKPFVVCDLAAVPMALIESELFGHVRGAFTGADRDRRGAFAEADGGTILLDEIGELDATVQPRLLRALEKRQIKPVGQAAYQEVDIRVIAATNRDLGDEVHAGRFRRDLFHRLSVVRLAIPPLRERPEDIPVLVEHFLAHAAGRPSPAVEPATLAALCGYDWPGNVRELKNTLERAVSVSPNPGLLDAAALGLEEARSEGDAPASADPGLTFHEARLRLLDAWEREYVASLLAKVDGNVSLAARRAGIARGSLHRILKKHGLGG